LLAFCTDTATRALYTLSLHDALPISRAGGGAGGHRGAAEAAVLERHFRLEGGIAAAVEDLAGVDAGDLGHGGQVGSRVVCGGMRSEEHTSELQSRENLVCRLLLEKKK